MKAERERERGDFRIRDAERVVRYLFFFFFCGAISGGFFFFVNPLAQMQNPKQCRTQKRGGEEMFLKGRTPHKY